MAEIKLLFLEVLSKLTHKVVLKTHLVSFVLAYEISFEYFHSGIYYISRLLVVPFQCVLGIKDE